MKKYRYKKYRYFITDNSATGTLVSGCIQGKEMLFLLGNAIAKKSSINVNEVVSMLCSRYGFTILKSGISKHELNTSDETPYTYYDLIDEFGYCEQDGYMYTDLDAISELFSDEKDQEILRSIKAFS